MCLIRLDGLTVRGYSSVDRVLWVRLGVSAVCFFLGLELSDCIDNNYDDTFQFHV